ncbi:MAG: helix-turn-helix transcriptional regulator [Acidimicrobiales bacterium]
MRADRLVAILLMLQSRGQVTAAEVADELEVSERTARRDLEALGTAGLPIYSQQGRNGGWRLLGGGRTDLSGLNAAEARALFLVAGPSSSATPEVKAALRKLVRALPETFRSDAEAASEAIVVDPTDWGRSPSTRPAPPHLEALQRAVIEGEQMRLGYVARDRSTSSRIVHPLGLAAKGQVWYLVADTDAGLRTFRVDRVTDLEPIGEPVVRPEGFDLVEAWRMITSEVDERRASTWARGTAAPDVVPLMRMMFGNLVRIGPTGDDGRVEVEVGSSNGHALAGQLAGLGNRVELSEPPEVIDRLADIAGELSDLYGSRDQPGPGSP